MRFVAVLLTIAGIALALAYPWWANTQTGHHVAFRRMQSAGTGYEPATYRFEPRDAPIDIELDVAALRQPGASPGQSALTITVATGGRTVLAETLDLSSASVRDDSPQTPEQMYRLEVGSIPEIEAADYVFTVGAGDAEADEILTVDLFLTGGREPVDPRAQPIGFSLAAVGIILFLMSFVPKQPENPNPRPPPPRWGRGRGPS